MSTENNHPIDEMMKRYLESHANDPQAMSLADRVLKAHSAPVRRRHKRFIRTVRWVSILAASVVVAFLGGLYITPLQASPQAVVRDALQAHALPVDRLYFVETTFDPRITVARIPGGERVRRNYLWTRGDSFWLEPISGRSSFAIGRDPSDELWMVVGGGNVGVHMPMNVVPEPVRMAAELMTMKVETLLTQVLDDFSLHEERAPRGTHLIVARPNKPMVAGKVNSITLEIDSPTRVVRRVVVERWNQGQPVATVSFQLLETGSQPDSAYTLEGHLGQGSKVIRGDEFPAIALRMFPLFR
jgi:hypothetical protein